MIQKNLHNFTFDVYRKPTNKNILLHYFSLHDTGLKKAVLHGTFLRALRVCSPANLSGEIDRIFQIFSKLGYPKHFIETVLSKTKNRFNAGAPSQSRNFASGAELLALPFYPKLAKYKSVLETASNVKLIFQYPNTLSKTLIKNSPKQAEVCGGVYRVPCLECGKCYFGETLKSLDVRLKQQI